jgi:hypothetical protein
MSFPEPSQNVNTAGWAGSHCRSSKVNGSGANAQGRRQSGLLRIWRPSTQAMPTIMASLRPRFAMAARSGGYWRVARLKGDLEDLGQHTTATLDMRADPQNLPAGLTHPRPGRGYAGFGGGDHSSAYVERAGISDFVRDHGITGFATIAGDRHSFWAGLAVAVRTSRHCLCHRFDLRAR